jgi:hypothetical protein
MVSKRRWSCLLTLALLAMVLTGSDVRADLIYAVQGADSDGPVQAQVTFTPGNGVLTIVIQDLQSGIHSAGQEVSQLLFSVGGGLGTPTGFTQLQGNTISFNKNGSVSGTGFDSASGPGSTPLLHWGFATSGSDVTLETVGNVAAGGQPQHMIVGPDPNPNASLHNFNPHFADSATFTLTDPGVTSSTVLTSSQIFNVQFGFGTGPEAVLEAVLVGPNSPVPEPGALAMLLSGGVCAGGVVACRRWKCRCACY